MDPLEERDAIIRELEQYICEAWAIMISDPEWQNQVDQSDERSAWIVQCIEWRSHAFGFMSRVRKGIRSRSYGDATIKMALDKSRKHTSG